MNSTFYGCDKNGNEILVDTTDFQISPNGYGLLVRTYPEKKLDAGDKCASFQGYLTVGKYIPEGKRKEFLSKCKKILSEYRDKKIEREKEKRKLKNVN